MKKISPIFKKMIMEYAYAKSKGKQARIAKKYGKSASRFNVVLNSVEGQMLLRFYQQQDEDATRQLYINKAKETGIIINDGSPYAAERLVEHAHSDNESISLKACNIILDKSEYDKERLKEIIKPQNITYTEQQIALFKEGFRKEEPNEDKDVIDG